jgi:lysozyme family protein
MTFEAAVAFVLAHEGGVSNDPRDPGGLTAFGISQRAHPDVDVSTLTREGAVALYRVRYWDACACDTLPAPLRLPLLDAAVQHGPTQAIRLLQDALGVRRDGILGPQTLMAAERLPWGDILVRFLAYRLRLYASLPHQSVFGLGWARRTLNVQRAVYEAALQGGS